MHTSAMAPQSFCGLTLTLFFSLVSLVLCFSLQPVTHQAVSHPVSHPASHPVVSQPVDFLFSHTISRLPHPHPVLCFVNFFFVVFFTSIAFGAAGAAGAAAAVFLTSVHLHDPDTSFFPGVPLTRTGESVVTCCHVFFFFLFVSYDTAPRYVIPMQWHSILQH
jgi:hypothetical protein